MDPPTVMMDLPTGWGKATYKDKKRGKIIAYYFNKDGLISSQVPPPPQYYDVEASLHEDGDNSLADDANKKMVTSITSKSWCSEQPDSWRTLCRQKRSRREGLMLLSRIYEHIIHSTKIPLLNISKLAGITSKPGPGWLS
jgi:hypothetical protein